MQSAACGVSFLVRIFFPFQVDTSNYCEKDRNYAGECKTAGGRLPGQPTDVHPHKAGYQGNH